MPVTAAVSPVQRSLRPIEYLDVAVVLVAAIPALLLGAPALGYALGGGGWILSRVAQRLDRRLTDRVEDPVRRAGVHLFEAFGRIWLLAAAIVAATLIGNHHDGLCAAVLILVAYSIAFTIRLADGAVAAGAAPAAGSRPTGPETHL